MLTLSLRTAFWLFSFFLAAGFGAAVVKQEWFQALCCLIGSVGIASPLILDRVEVED